MRLASGSPLFRIRLPLCHLCFRTHLFHHLTHRREVPGRALLNPRLVPFGGFFQMREVKLTRELLAALFERGLDTLPHSEKFAARLEEEVFVEQTVIEQGASL